jgi:hypothetical protein
MRAIYVLAAMAMTTAAYAVELDLSAFDGEPIKACAAVVDLSAFDAEPISLQAFDAVPHVDLSAFDEPQRPAVKPSPAAINSLMRASSVEMPATVYKRPDDEKLRLVEHLIAHPNHAGKYDFGTLWKCDMATLEAMHTRDHQAQEASSKPVQVAEAKQTAIPAAVDCPNGRCPARVLSSATVTAQGMTPTRQTPQPVLYYQSCPGGVCPTPQRRGLFGLLKGGR